MTGKCRYQGCTETFEGDQPPSGWGELTNGSGGTTGWFWCPKHVEEVQQEAYRRILAEAEPEGRA